MNGSNCVFYLFKDYYTSQSETSFNVNTPSPLESHKANAAFSILEFTSKSYFLPHHLLIKRIYTDHEAHLYFNGIFIRLPWQAKPILIMRWQRKW